MALSIGVGSILKIYNITISLTAREDKIYSRYPYVFFFIILYFLIITARSYVNTHIKAFMDLKFKLTNYSIIGINALYLIGCLERDNYIDDNTSPFAITNRSKISSLLGGDDEFKQVILNFPILNVLSAVLD